MDTKDPPDHTPQGDIATLTSGARAYSFAPGADQMRMGLVNTSRECQVLVRLFLDYPVILAVDGNDVLLIIRARYRDSGIKAAGGIHLGSESYHAVVD